MIIPDRARFLEHVRVGTVFWYLCHHESEYTLHGPHIVEKFTAPDQDYPTGRVLTWLVSISDQRIFGAPQTDTVRLLQELTSVNDLFHNGGVVLTTEAEAEACHLGTLLRRDPAGVAAA